jgi:hypothetical protein
MLFGPTKVILLAKLHEAKGSMQGADATLGRLVRSPYFLEWMLGKEVPCPSR